MKKKSLICKRNSCPTTLRRLSVRLMKEQLGYRSNNPKLGRTRTAENKICRSRFPSFSLQPSNQIQNTQHLIIISPNPGEDLSFITMGLSFIHLISCSFIHHIYGEIKLMGVSTGQHHNDNSTSGHFYARLFLSQITKHSREKPETVTTERSNHGIPTDP